jgi:hypothetical protein
LKESGEKQLYERKLLKSAKETEEAQSAKM